MVLSQWRCGCPNQEATRPNTESTSLCIIRGKHVHYCVSSCASIIELQKQESFLKQKYLLRRGVPHFFLSLKINRIMMNSEFFLVTQPNPSPVPSIPRRGFVRFGFSARNDPKHHRVRHKLVAQSFGDKWKLKDIDAGPVQERWNLWLLKTQNFLNGVTSPLVKAEQAGKPDLEIALDVGEIEEVFIDEQTIDIRTPSGNLSLPAIVSIEQFSRMNGLNGRKMQQIYETLIPESRRNDARNLIEYCCFRFLSKDSADFHPSLKEPAFRRLIFITMLAWECPYSEVNDLRSNISEISVKKVVGKEAFVRIAPAIAGVADRSTAANLFKCLIGNENGLSLGLWTAYIEELLKVHIGRKSYHVKEFMDPNSEQILCVGSSKKRPVLKWENNMAWPGTLTLTTKALYYEAVGLGNQNETIRLDLSGYGTHVEKAKVGPFGSALFDSAVSVSSDSESKTWVLEFVDFGGEMRRDVWYAFISEVIALHEYIREYGPEDGDQSGSHVYGAHRGNMRAITSAINSITRLQALQSIRKLSEDPVKLVQFSYLRSAPYGDIVRQALAVNFWGGPLVTKFTEVGHRQGIRPSDDLSGSNVNVFDIDGSVYLRKWMKSPSWASNASVSFWKDTQLRPGIVLSKNLVVADKTLVEKAAVICEEKSRVVQKAQATIDAATLKGIPSNIDLFKELMLPLVIIAKNFDKLRSWKEPHVTVSFLAFAYTIIFRNMLSYVFPMTLMAVAAYMLLLKGLKEQGRLGRSFGKVTIRDQPSSNTIQKFMAIKEAMIDLESYLQNLNVSLLKIRTIVLSDQPQITTEIALVLLSSATILLIVPFRYILAFLLLDLFTQKLEFRREMFIRFISILKERWDTVPAAPVVVLPAESDETGSVNSSKGNDNNQKKSKGYSTENSR